MPRMSDADKKRMRDESAHADHVWQEKGLTTHQPGTWNETSIFTHMDAYRGDQWRTIGLLRGVAFESHLVVNAMFSTLNTLQAQLLARNPRVKVWPRQFKWAQNAKSFKDLLNYLIEEAKLQRAWNAAARDAFYRVGFVRVGYTPPQETVSEKGLYIERGPSALDIPWMRRVAPWDIRIDPLAESWHADGDARWCEFITLTTMNELKANPGITVPRDLQPTVSKDKRTRDERRMRDLHLHEAGNLVELRTRYDRVERKWFQWTPGSEKLLREPDDWPASLQGLEGLPYSMLAFNEQADDPCPIGYADVLWPLQVERNKVRTILNELTKRMRRLIVANANAFTDEDKNKLADADLVEILFANGNVGDVAAQIPIAGFDQTLLLYDQMIQEDIRETLGQSRMARAQRINVTSATEAAAVAQGDTTLMGRNQGAVEAWLKDSIRLYAKVVQGSVTDKIAIPVVGAEDTAALMAGEGQVLQIEPQQIQGEFLFDIEIGSTLPRDERQEIAKEMAWLGIAEKFPNVTNLPDALLKLAVAMGKSPREALLTAAQQQATAQQIPGTVPTEPAKGGASNLNPAIFALPSGEEAIQ